MKVVYLQLFHKAQGMWELYSKEHVLEWVFNVHTYMIPVPKLPSTKTAQCQNCPVHGYDKLADYRVK